MLALAERHVHDQALLDRWQAATPHAQTAPSWIRQLVLAADQFIVQRPRPDVPDGQTIIAGYPWFGDWGRDTMISLAGLTLTTGRPQIARQILQTFSHYLDRGMLPNVFPEVGRNASLQYRRCDAVVLRSDSHLPCGHPG